MIIIAHSDRFKHIEFSTLRFWFYFWILLKVMIYKMPDFKNNKIFFVFSVINYYYYWALIKEFPTGNSNCDRISYVVMK